MDYETDPFKVLRAAMSQLCADAIYLETEGDLPHKPCPDYVAHLQAASRQIDAAETFADLASVEWIAGKAALALY